MKKEKLTEYTPYADRMILAIEAHNATVGEDLRKTALAQAAHDLKGQGDPAAVVSRAEVYLQFLKGDAA